MALIKCPECGGDVSSAAPHCIHCGCTITVCPDCGNVVVGDVRSCSQCGCVIALDRNEKDVATQTSASVVQNASHDNVDSVDMRSRWLGSSTIDSFLFKKRKIITRIVSTIGLGLLLFAAVQIIVWNTGSDIEKLAGFQSAWSSAKAIVVAAAIIMVFSGISNDLFGLILTFRLANRLNGEDADISDCLKRMSDTLTTQDSYFSAFANIFWNAVYALKNKGGKAKLILQGLLEFICLAVLMFGCMLFILDNADSFATHLCFDVPFVCDYMWLIVVGCGLALNIAYSFVELVLGKKRKEWVRKFANID